MKTPLLNVSMAAPKKARIDIYDDIGPSWAGMIDTKSVSRELAKLGDVDSIEVHINSRGGSAWEGLGIASLLRDHPAKIEVVVDGIAASAATLPVMVADRVRIPKNAILMIHDPWTIAMGGEAEFKAAIANLATTKKASIALYAAKSKKSESEISAIMSAETWYTGDEAVAAGFADVTENEIEAAKAPNQASVKQAVQELFTQPTWVASVVQESTTEKPMSKVNETPKATPAVENELVALTAVELKPAITQEEVQAAAAKASKEAVESERKRAADLTAMCKLAGKQEAAQKYIETGLSVEDARKEMYELVCKERAPKDDGGSSMEVPAGDPADAKYKAEFAANKAAYAKNGVSEADYVKSRRIDDGLDQLAPKTA